MTDTPQDPTTPPMSPVSAEAVEELVESLVGVASARAVLADDGEVEEIHVLALPGTTREDVTRSVRTALRARFDLKPDRSGIFVARIEEADTEASPAGEEVGEGHLPAASREVGLPPWPERPLDDVAPGAPGAAEAAEPMGAGREGGSSHRTGGRATEGLESRLLFLGHRMAKRRFKAVEVAVDLQWRGRRHRGAASVEDRAPERLEAPALATLRALDAALEQCPASEKPRQVRLTLRGVEMVEALGQRHIMVSILAEVGHQATPLTGTVVVDDSVELATILATLQATDRRVRAVLLNHLPGNGGPPTRG